ncbi:MAG: hypothetical protein ACRCUG_01695 [Yersinia sp. (in: enterobacteria)]
MTLVLPRLSCQPGWLFWVSAETVLLRLIEKMKVNSTLKLITRFVISIDCAFNLGEFALYQSIIAIIL